MIFFYLNFERYNKYLNIMKLNKVNIQTFNNPLNKKGVKLTPFFLKKGGKLALVKLLILVNGC